MQNIQDVWQKTLKIKQLRSMFSQDFGTTITEDKLPRAHNDPNRNQSILDARHIERARQEDQNLIKRALEIASKRASSIQQIDSQIEPKIEQ